MPWTRLTLVQSKLCECKKRKLFNASDLQANTLQIHRISLLVVDGGNDRSSSHIKLFISGIQRADGSRAESPSRHNRCRPRWTKGQNSPWDPKPPGGPSSPSGSPWMGDSETGCTSDNIQKQNPVTAALETSVSGQIDFSKETMFSSLHDDCFSPLTSVSHRVIFWFYHWRVSEMFWLYT